MDTSLLKCDACLEGLQDKIFSHQKDFCSYVLVLRLQVKLVRPSHVTYGPAVQGWWITLSERASLLHQKALDYWLWFCKLQNHLSLVYLSTGLNKSDCQIVSGRSGQTMLMCDLGVPNLDLFSSWHSRRLPATFLLGTAWVLGCVPISLSWGNLASNKYPI